MQSWRKTEQWQLKETLSPDTTSCWNSEWNCPSLTSLLDALHSFSWFSFTPLLLQLITIFIIFFLLINHRLAVDTERLIEVFINHD